MRRTVLMIAVFCAGCGGPDPTADVTGTVTYNGAPLNKPGGKIVFVGPAGSQVVADIAADGSYRAPGVPAGPNRVAVYYPNPEAKMGEKHLPEKGRIPPKVTPPMPPPFVTPYKYASPDTSELAVTVGPGTVYNADLVGPKIR